MLDLEKVTNEFIFLREKIREVSVFVANSQHTDAAFLLGCLHNICHNHSITIGQLVPPKFQTDPSVVLEALKDEETAV